MNSENTLPIHAAYTAAGALEIRCSNCHSAVGVWCTRDDGRVRRTPCVARCRVSTPIPVSTDPCPATDPAAGRSDRPLVLDLDCPDPSEPRHQRDDE